MPSNLINDILIARNGVIWVATDEGLAYSQNRGRTWKFVRGRDWEAKDKQLYHGPPKKRIEYTAKHFRHNDLLLSGDHCTCLAQGAAGYIWVGHWRKGIDVIDPYSNKSYRSNGKPIRSQPKESKGNKKKKLGPRDEVSAMLTLPGQPPLVAFYGGGVIQMPQKFTFAGRAGVSPVIGRRPTNATTNYHSADSHVGSNSKFPSLPASPSPPTLQKLKHILTQINQLLHTSSPGHQPIVVPMIDDWRTQGDWLGRYGKYWACLCAIDSPVNYIWGAGKYHINYYAQIGPHHRKDDALRHWIQWLYTSNPSALEMPPTYLSSRIISGFTTRKSGRIRRAASWDDHGERYSLTYSGPNVYCTLMVPRGLFRLSLYFFNKDGHTTTARLRDFPINILLHPKNVSITHLGRVKKLTLLTSARVHNFWHAVYKRFMVRGPVNLTIEIKRNESVDTIISGIFLDSFDPTPLPFFESAAQGIKGLKKQATERSNRKSKSTIAGKLFRAMETARTTNPKWWAAHYQYIYAMLLRYDLAIKQIKHSETASKPVSKILKQIGVCYYRLNLLPKWEATLKQRGLRTAREIEKSIKWTKHFSSCSGKGRIILKRYLVKHRKGKQTKAD